MASSTSKRDWAASATDHKIRKQRRLNKPTDVNVALKAQSTDPLLVMRFARSAAACVMLVLAAVRAGREFETRIVPPPGDSPRNRVDELDPAALPLQRQSPDPEPDE